MSTTPPSTPLELAQQRLANYLAAEARILQSQEYTVGQGGTARRNRRADLEQVQAGIKTAQAEIAALQAAQTGARRITYLRPR
nr:hypothetical protein [uncultured Acidovorax sp.]